MEILLALIEFMRAAIWPAFLVWLIFRYHADFRGLITKIRKVTPGGFELDAQQQDPTHPVDAPISALRDPTPAVLEEETYIRQHFLEKSSDPRDVVLLRAAALGRLAAKFDSTYWRIFGSQIRALRELSKTGRTTRKEAIEYFEANVRPAFPDVYANSPFDQWAKTSGERTKPWAWHFKTEVLKLFYSQRA